MGALTHNGEIMQGLPANASQINFDKTGTDLSATQTENAIKEVNGKVNANAEDITQLKSGLNVSQSGTTLSDLATYLSTLTTTQKCRSVLKVEYGTSNVVMPIYTYNPVEYQLTYGGGSANMIYDMFQYYSGAFRKFRKKNDLTIETTDLSENVTGWTLYINS